jgi:hypothetical protein
MGHVIFFNFINEYSLIRGVCHTLFLDCIFRTETTLTYEDTIYDFDHKWKTQHSTSISLNEFTKYNPHLYKLTFHCTCCYLHCSLSVGYITK